ncbi:hypothetical protein D3C73_804420 [compost metagenome]
MGISEQGEHMFKLIIGMGIYFIAILLMSYYFVGVSFIKALQMASFITIQNILILYIDRHYKRLTNKLCALENISLNLNSL